MEKILANQKQVGKGGKIVLTDMYRLAELLLINGECVEAHLYARRVLRGYKKLSNDGLSGVEMALILLVDICGKDGKVDEEEAYAAMLADSREKRAFAPGDANALMEDQPLRVQSKAPDVFSMNMSHSGSSLSSLALRPRLASKENPGVSTNIEPKNGERTKITRVVKEKDLSIPKSGAAKKPLMGLTGLTLLQAPEPSTRHSRSKSLQSTSSLSLVQPRSAQTNVVETFRLPVPPAVPCIEPSKLPVPNPFPPDVQRKLAIVGDGACGKSCLVVMYAKRTFPEVDIPTVFENYVSAVMVDDVCVELALWDTAGVG